MTKDKQELMDFILDHYENPRNSGSLSDEKETHSCDILQNGGNPGCGDIVTICLKIENDIITEKITFCKLINGLRGVKNRPFYLVCLELIWT